ncbi:hypothetical protein PTTG_01822 [Puccinia triticina 1-1 BBBD Race 1]|uniref:Secreted protein n=2 Tax=Puccinia triticina TaxID=208348 RepID=A0A0C4EM33_PUCT1|nr:uncharacterized protein PtA15_11A588 [Puccinia triticina]OAV98539.1 hypothetical protein PTTG_01822 [Puccinia triticina 1-1 BBBD Race 1]WAQ89896.1 hypothetical protein PtA15_11A588 [Puccinia triticina]
MKPSNGFSYLLILFAVTSICLSALQAGEQTFSHYLARGERDTTYIHEFGSGPVQTRVYVRYARRNNRRAQYTIYANNPTRFWTSIKLQVKSRNIIHSFRGTLRPNSNSRALAKVYEMPRTVRVDYTIHDLPQDVIEAAGPPADTIHNLPQDVLDAAGPPADTIHNLPQDVIEAAGPPADTIHNLPQDVLDEAGPPAGSDTKY